jgi:hypothetical protein
VKEWDGWICVYIESGSVNGRLRFHVKGETRDAGKKSGNDEKET